MTEIKNNIILPDAETKRIDLEKLLIWSLRKRDYVYEDVNVGGKLELIFNFEFVEEQEAPMKYEDIIQEFNTEPNTELAMKQDTEQDIEQDALDEGDICTQSKVMFRSPNNTEYFKSWAKDNKIKKFTLQSFVASVTFMNKELATKIVAHQVRKKTIRQLDNDTFEIIGEL